MSLFALVNNHSLWLPTQDPKKNRIAQWLNVTPVGGIVDLSFPLAAEAPVGEYTIKTPDRTHTFSVEEYGKGLGSSQQQRKIHSLQIPNFLQGWTGLAAVNSCASCAICASTSNVPPCANRCYHWLSLRPTGFLLPHVLRRDWGTVLQLCSVKWTKAVYSHHILLAMLLLHSYKALCQSCQGQGLPFCEQPSGEVLDIWDKQALSPYCIIFLLLSHSSAQVQCLHPDASGGHHLGGDLPSPYLWHVSWLTLAEAAFLLF